MTTEPSVANKERGEVALTATRADGSTKDYALAMTTNAVVQLETRLKRKFGEVLNDAATLSFTSIRDLVWPFLQRHHKDEFKNLESVGDLIDDAGGPLVVLNAIKDMVELNATKNTNGSGRADPQTAQLGTGAGNT